MSFRRILPPSDNLDLRYCEALTTKPKVDWLTDGPRCLPALTEGSERRGKASKRRRKAHFGVYVRLCMCSCVCVCVCVWGSSRQKKESHYVTAASSASGCGAARGLCCRRGCSGCCPPADAIGNCCSSTSLACLLLRVNWFAKLQTRRGAHVFSVCYECYAWKIFYLTARWGSFTHLA